MLPVVDKPAIQYIVEEALEAGVDEVIIVNSRDKKSIEDQFSRTMCSLSTYAVWARTHMPMPSSMRARFP